MFKNKMSSTADTNPSTGPLYITLKQPVGPSTSFQPGDSLHGVVRVEAHVNPAAISISLKGRARFSVVVGPPENKMLLAEKSNLFSINCKPQPSDAIDSDGRHRLIPFHFTFPFNVDIPPPISHGMPFTPNPNFEHLPGHALPPTFHHLFRDQEQTIQYYLEAEDISQQHSTGSNASSDRKGAGSSKGRARMYLPFTPSSAIPPRVLPHSGLQFHTTDVAKERHGVLNRLFHRKHDVPDHGRLAITSSVPAVGYIGQRLPIRLSLTKSEDADGPSTTTLILRGFHVQLTRYTRARVPMNFEWEQDTEAATYVAEKIRVSDYQTGSSSHHVLRDDGGKGVLLSDLDNGLRIAETMVPSFRTYGLAVSYVLKVVVDVECLGKVVHLEVANDAIYILPVGEEVPAYVEKEE